MDCPNCGKKLVVGFRGYAEGPEIEIVCREVLAFEEEMSRAAKESARVGDWGPYYSMLRSNACGYRLELWEEGVEDGLMKLFQKALDETDLSILLRDST
jgi:hypothetical protein